MDDLKTNGSGISDTLLIGVDFTHNKDTGVLVVGRKQKGGIVEIVNAFQGKEAEELYKKLITKKSDKKEI